MENKSPENNSQDLEEKSKTEEKTTDDDISSNSDYEVLPNPSNFDDLISQQEIEVENVLSGNCLYTSLTNNCFLNKYGYNLTIYFVKINLLF